IPNSGSHPRPLMGRLLLYLQREDPTCLLTLRWKERTQRMPRQILLPTAIISLASLSLLWESRPGPVPRSHATVSPRRDIAEVPVSRGSVGSLQVTVYVVSVYLARVVAEVPVYLPRVVPGGKALMPAPE